MTGRLTGKVALIVGSAGGHRGPAFIKNTRVSILLGRLGTTIVVDGGQLFPEGRDFGILPP
jgi:hypothetical protein